MSDCRIVVASCESRKAIQEIFRACFDESWPDCRFPVTVISPEVDKGWNANLIECLRSVDEKYVLLMLDDHFLEPGDYTNAVDMALSVMDAYDVGLLKLQDLNAHSPEIPFAVWPILREYDHEHHPFKRTNLVPTLFRRDYLMRLSQAVLDRCGHERDQARSGAIEFEVTGTELTENAAEWPEMMLGIYRPNPDGSGGEPIMRCTDGDGVREGKLKAGLELELAGIEGIEAFL
jgi:hypothetical protein